MARPAATAPRSAATAKANLTVEMLLIGDIGDLLLDPVSPSFDGLRSSIGPAGSPIIGYIP
jgi:hypothetical protein